MATKKKKAPVRTVKKPVGAATVEPIIEKEEKRIPEIVKKPLRKTATPENPRPEEESAVSVNPSYDEMPDEVEDPAAVFKLAFLDMQVKAEVNALAIIAQEYEKRVRILEMERTTKLNEAKLRVSNAQTRLRQHKDHIENLYGLALRSYTYNDETGVLKKQAILKAEEAEGNKNPATSDEANVPSETVH